MSNMTRPKPPLCSTRSVALNARSRLFAQRIHNKRSNAMPACAAEAGSNLSPISISAHASSAQVACAKTESRTLVRPDEVAPVISVMAPRGRPFESASISAMPVISVSNENFRLGANELSKRLASADSISLFEIAALTFHHSIFSNHAHHYTLNAHAVSRLYHDRFITWIGGF